MTPLGIHYFPLAPGFFLILVVIYALLLVMLALHVLQYAHITMGVRPGSLLFLMALSLVGSYINIPVVRLPGERIVQAQEITFFGMHYVLPVVRDWPGTVIAVNVGGAVIPALLSVYLLLRNSLYVKGTIAVAVVTLVCHAVAYAVPGLGIAVPVFVPPLAAAGVSLVLSPRFAGALSYMSGSLGTLIGADLLNLDKIRGLGAPVASIGGAGTFDGIFVTGLMALILASLIGGIPRRSTRR
jgi:uncharacterized membrane protein